MKIVIAGAGAVGTHLAKLLSRERRDCVLIDEDDERLSALADYDVMTYAASPVSLSALREAGTAGCDLFVGVTPQETTNVTACMMARALGAKKTVARIDNYEYLKPQNTELFRKMGIDALVYPEVLAAIDINNSLKLSWVRQRWDVHDGALTLLGIKLRETAEILNQPLRQLCGPDDPYHIVAIKRGDDTIIPGGLDELKAGDLIYVMTTKAYIPYIRRIVGKEHYADVKNVIVMGGDKTSVRAALTAPDYMNIKIIEKNATRCEQLNALLGSSDAMVIHGDGRDLALLEEEGIRHTQAFVALTGNAETNILACLAAKRLGVRKTIAMVENLDYISMAEQLDIGTVINKMTIAANRIFQMLMEAEVDNLRSLMLVDAEVAEFTAAEGSRVTRKPVRDLGLPAGATIGGLVRRGEGMLVSGSSEIKAGDKVMVFCHEAKLNVVEKFFKKSTIW